MSEHVTWAKGGSASFTVVDDDEVTLRSSIPSPPGSRLEGTLAGAEPAAVKVKIHTSKREADGSFMLRGKLLEASRPLRDRVASLLR
ncbi:MAG: hypothetical protein JWP97_2115 [Labilithrix sp.]|nr:hypothetical protein [Labilithrix sp.]